MHRFLLLIMLVAGALAEPLVHYPFDGNVEPARGADLGKPEVKGEVSFVDGQQGQAVVLRDGAVLNLPLPPQMREGEWTICFWLRPLWHPQDQLPHPILEIPAAPDTYDQIDWSASHLLVSKGWSKVINPNGWYGISNSLANRFVAPGQWTHVALMRSREGQFTANYVMGQGERRREDGERLYDLHGLTMTLGGRARGTHGFGNIVVDDLRIYGRALSVEELEEAAGVKFPPPLDVAAFTGSCDPEAMVPMPGKTWAPKLPGGPVRVLALCESTRGRDILELSRRLEMQLTMITGPNVAQETMVSPERWEEMGKEAEAALAKGDVDVVLIGAFPWNRLLESSRTAILDYVRAGGGLLFVDPRVNNVKGAHHSAGHGLSLGWKGTEPGDAVEALLPGLETVDQRFLTAAVPWHHLRPFQELVGRQDPEQLFRGGAVGQGRILLYEIWCGGHARQESVTPNLSGGVDYTAFEYDYSLGAAGRTLLWTAGRVQEHLRIVAVRYETLHGFRGLALGTRGTWVATVYNPGAEDVNASLQTTVRTDGPDAPWTNSRGLRAAPGYSEVAVRYDLERVGRVFADLRLERGPEVLDWASGAIEVGSGNPSLVRLDLAKTAWEPGERPVLRTGMRYVDYGDKPTPPAVLSWRLFDAYGRLIERGEQPANLPRRDQAVAELTWQLPPLPEYSRRFTLLVDLAAKGQTSDQRRLEFTCTAGIPRGFTWYAWDGGDGAAQHRAIELLRDQYGLDSAMAYVAHDPPGAGTARDFARINRMNLRPWAYATHLGGRGVNEQGQRIPDMADLVDRRQGEERLAEIVRIGKAYSPMFYSLGDEVKLGPWDAEPTGAEQDLFRRRMQDRYGKIEAFNEAFGSDYENWGQVRLPRKDDDPKPATQKLLRVWRHQLFNELLADYVAAGQAVDPEARLGIEGIFGLQHAWTAFDYWGLVRGSTFIGQYALGLDLDIVRGFAAPDDLISCWYNYALMDEHYGKYGPWHTALRGLNCFGWFRAYMPGRYSTLCPDFTPTPQWAWTWSELEDLDRGLGDLMLGLDRDNPGVHVLYEFANLYRSSEEFYAFDVMSQFLDDAGIMHDYISAEQVAAGGLDRSRVLVLAGQRVMAPAVATAIRQWVEAGGIVVVDHQPALSDGLKDYEQPLLADLIPEADGAAASVEREVGKGRVLRYFAPYPADYREQRFTEVAAGLRQDLWDFLARHGAATPFRVTPKDGNFRPATVVAYRDGAARYVGVQRDYKLADTAPATFTVAAPEAAHVYDCRAGKYLGRADRVDVELPVAEGRLYAFLPYQAKALQLSGLPATCSPGTALPLRATLAVDGATPGLGFLRVDVFGPDGKAVPALSGKHPMVGGIAAVPLKIAWNEPGGAWRIVCRDLATGATAAHQLTVE